MAKEKIRLQEGEVLTLEETARLLKVSKGTVRTWLKRGKFPHATRIGGRKWAILLCDIEAYFLRKNERRKFSRGPHKKTPKNGAKKGHFGGVG